MAVYVQHITGYGPHDAYDTKAAAMTAAGFVKLQSEPSEPHDGLRWEIWYLPSLYAAKGALLNYLGNPLQATDDQVATWLMRHVSPGEIELSGPRYGLSPG